MGLWVYGFMGLWVCGFVGLSRICQVKCVISFTQHKGCFFAVPAFLG